MKKNLKITEKDNSLIGFLVNNEHSALDKIELSKVVRIIIIKHNELIKHLENL